MRLPEIECKRTDDGWTVRSEGHTYGKRMNRQEAETMHRMLDHYRNLATMHLLCKGLDGESIIPEPAFVPLTAEQARTLSPGDLLLHPQTGAVFLIEELQASVSNNAHVMTTGPMANMQSALVAACAEIVLKCRNYTA